MSSTQNTASPRGPRAKHQHSKSATQAPHNNDGKQSQRRHKGNRAKHGNNNAADLSPSRPPPSAQDPAFADSAVLSSEEVHIPTGPRNAKKHTQSQPSSDRVFSPTTIQAASLTDSELPPSNPTATPAKAQAAYAGPTFHASPAPSALPIPKFLSKSVPAKARSGPPTPPDDGSDSASSPTPSPPSPSRGAPIPVPARESPLDMLFNADRAEKARHTNGSPGSASFTNSPNPSSVNVHRHHSKHNSQTSLNVMFPIELDAESKAPQLSPPSTASPVTNRSVTAPSRVPQVGNTAPPNNDSAAIQDLLNRLSQSQKPPTASTPPRTVEHMPSEPSSRHHTPSPFHDGRSAQRSASGPTTPAPSTQEQSSDFFYGNRNLSPLFKAAKNDGAKRNSGLRTEITADSPILPNQGFPPVNGTPQPMGVAGPNNRPNNTYGPPAGPRRGSIPHIPPYRETQNNRKPRTPGKRTHHPRPDSYPNANNGAPAPAPPQASKPNPFIPASVQAKQFPKAPRAAAPASDSLSLEQDLKRLLNLGSETNGVR